MAQSKGVNLLPRKSRAELKEDSKRTSTVIQSSIVTMIAIFIAVGLLGFNQYQKYTIEGVDLAFLQLKGLDNEIKDLNEQAHTYDDVLGANIELSQKLEFSQVIVEERPDFKKTLDRLISLVPEGIEINRYAIDESDVVAMSGEAPRFFNLAVFVNRAQKEDASQGFFTDFFLDGAAKSGDVVKFSIRAKAIFDPVEIIEETEESTDG